MCNCPNQGLGFGSGCQPCRPPSDWVFNKSSPRQAPHLFANMNISSGGRVFGNGSVPTSGGPIVGDIAQRTGSLLRGSNTPFGPSHVGLFGHGQCSLGSYLPSSGKNGKNGNNDKNNNKPTFGSAQTTGGLSGNNQAPRPSDGRPFGGANNAKRPDFVPTEPTGRHFGHAQASSQPSSSRIFGHRESKGSGQFGASSNQGQQQSQQPQQVFNTYNIGWKYYNYSKNSGPRQTKR